MKDGVNTGAPIAALHGAGAILAALYYRAETEAGQLIDLSPQESAVAVIGHAVLGYALSGVIPQPLGNRDPDKVPQGWGEGRWLAITLRTNEE